MGSQSMWQKLGEIWQTYDIRMLMLTSLAIQACLTFAAPYRKSCGNGTFRLLIWLLYLCADSVALFTIGLIARSPGSDEFDPQNNVSEDLLVFWASFLALHLGGPDTITALALEDNELWHRHALQLATQVGITLYVLVVAVIKNSKLLAPSLLVFVDGFIKYMERTCALYFASMENFRLSQLLVEHEPRMDYHKVVEEYVSAVDANIPAVLRGMDGPPDGNVASKESKIFREVNFGGGESYEITDASYQLSWYRVKETEEMVVEAYHFCENFKRLIADASLSLKDCDESRASFLHSSKPDVTFRTVEIELNLIYDIFYTKVYLLQKQFSCARLFCFPAVIASLVLFSFADKSKYLTVDVGITFALLIGAITMDIVSLVMFLSSDWYTIINSSLQQHWEKLSSPLVKGFNSCLRWAHQCCYRCWSHSGPRWSESTYEYNLLNCCFDTPPWWVEHIYIRRIKELFIGLLYVKPKPVGHYLGNFILEELQHKARIATDIELIKQACLARGDLVFHDDSLLVSEYLRPWTLDMDYDESVLTWHMATDICYWMTPNEEGKINDPHRKMSKQLSDYMSYILLRKQALVFKIVGSSDIRFEHTCKEVKGIKSALLDKTAKKFVICNKIWKRLVSNHDYNQGHQILNDFCAKVVDESTKRPPIIAKDDKSKSVLFEACHLANQLNMLGEKQWKITTKVWVEMLCYAAVRCSPRSHVAELCNGGELITIVWLLMAHLGLGEQFRQNRGFGWWTKLIIDN